MERRKEICYLFVTVVTILIHIIWIFIIKGVINFGLCILSEEVLVLKKSDSFISFYFPSLIVIYSVHIFFFYRVNVSGVELINTYIKARIIFRDSKS